MEPSFLKRLIFLAALSSILMPLLLAQPVVAPDSESASVRIDHVNFARCAVPRFDLPVGQLDADKALGRTYAFFSPHNVLYPEPSSDEARAGETRRGGYFDIWDLFSEAGPDGPHAMTLEFVVEAPRLTGCFLSLGCNDSCVVFVDHKPVRGVTGGREHCLGQNVVPVALTRGRAVVTLLLWKKNDWVSLPKDHFLNEWAVNIAVCPTLEAAWSTYRSNNYHFLDTPVVKNFSDFRSDVSLEEHNNVKVYDLKGVQVLEGKISPEGKLQLNRTAGVPLPFVGIMTMGDQMAEAIVVEGESSVDAMTDGILANGSRDVPDWGAWEFRCRHLLKPDYVKSRDHWWARKVALSFCMAGLQTKYDPTAEPFRYWKSAAIGFHPYKSEIDGTTQHYRALVGPAKNGRSRPLAVFLPGAPMPVRQYLESYGVSDMNETEMLARLAESYDVDLLWPGNVDIDYGGNYTRQWVDEAIRAFQADHPAVGYRPIYTIGSCAAGVAALGYAESCGGVDGVVFWSPIVTRNTYRWPVADKDWPPMMPNEAFAPESTDTNLAGLKKLPMFCIFDSDVSGHGDREGTKRFCDALSGMGGKVDQRWIPHPDSVLEWGVRATDSEAEWLNWIAGNAPKTGPRYPHRSPLPAQTIKDALLRGYAFERPGTQVESAWLDRWLATVAQYRGSVAEPSRSAGATRVRIKPISREEMISILESGNTAGRSEQTQEKHWSESLTGFSEIWAVTLNSGAPSIVEVAHSGASNDAPIPLFDLFKEGCCRGAVWGLRNGKWELLKLWF